MKGGTRKRGSTWSYYFDCGTVDGKRKKKEKGGFRTRSEAQAALQKAISEYNSSGEVFSASSITVSDYLDQWSDLYLSVNLAYRTQISYLSIIKNHLKPRFGYRKLKTLKPVDIQEFVNDLKIEGFSLSHIKNIMTVLCESLDYAVEPLRYIAQNPARHVRMPQITRKPAERIILTMDDWKRITDRFSDSRFYVMLMIGFYTGMRISEVCGLTWDDINLKERKIIVSKQIIKRSPGHDLRKDFQKNGEAGLVSNWYVQPTKTKSSVRTIYFGEVLAEVLRDELKTQRKNELKRGNSYIVHVIESEIDEKGQKMQKIVPVVKSMQGSYKRINLVCIGSDGSYTSSDSFKYAARVIHYELQIPFNFHCLRHTHATMLIENGADVKDVQKRLGHSSASTTIDTYVHDTDQMKRRSVDIFETAVNENKF